MVNVVIWIPHCYNRAMTYFSVQFNKISFWLADCGIRLKGLSVSEICDYHTNMHKICTDAQIQSLAVGLTKHKTLLLVSDDGAYVIIQKLNWS